MEHYVTLFDSLFLPQGLALHMSMERHVKNYQLWILCVDDEVFAVLTKLSLSNVRLLQLSKLETEELLKVKVDRTNGEYCWTLTPFAPRFVFEADATVERVTYLDADLWFRKDPLPIFIELDSSKKDVLITDHAYAAKYDHSTTSGQYCVQFMTFSRLGGEVVRKWWEGKCLDWCYARHENGKFGDQKYLDDWPERFAEKVHTLVDKELVMAPWSAQRYPYGRSCVWHFHNVRIRTDGKDLLMSYGEYRLPYVVKQFVYKTYFHDLKQSIKILKINNCALRLKSQNLFLARIFDLKRTLQHLLFSFLNNLNCNVKLTED